MNVCLLGSCVCGDNERRAGNDVGRGDRNESSFFQHSTRAVAVTLILLTFIAQPFVSHAERSPYEWAQVRLDFARNEKVAHLKYFCDRIHKLAQQAATDESVIGFFNINLQYSQAVAEGPVPDKLTVTVEELRKGFNRYYIENYLSFYDFLLVDMQGRVFYTLRKESDFTANLLEQASKGSRLAQCLKDCPEQEVFIDFHEYGPSSEPASFFVEPIRIDGVQKGWIVLQCAINKINTLFAWTEDLGNTGETFLVNQEGYMLTESSFEVASTILKKHLDDRNIQPKFEEGTGHRTVTDYRGFTVLTSFEVVSFLGTRWLVVAKIDKAEITTEHYSRHRRYFGDLFLEYLRKADIPPSRPVTATSPRSALRVDMDEFLKAGNGELLETFGVSTCTGLIGTYPGRFGYLAHISPRDKVYGSDDTNLLGQMVMRIENFDIYPSEIHDVQFVVVATHLESLLNIMDKLIEEGFLLSQIQIMVNQQAHSATMFYDYQKSELTVTWKMMDPATTLVTHYLEDAYSASVILEEMMALDSESVDSASLPSRKE